MERSKATGGRPSGFAPDAQRPAARVPRPLPHPLAGVLAPRDADAGRRGRQHPRVLARAGAVRGRGPHPFHRRLKLLEAETRRAHPRRAS